MNEARNAILARLRTTVNASQKALTDKQQESYVPIHDWDTTERIARFTERMQAVRAEVHQCEDRRWLSVLTQICQQKGINDLLYSADTQWSAELQQAEQNQNFPQLNTYASDIEEWKEDLFYNTDASITTTLCGIAETGTLVLWPSEHEPRLMSLVPPVHIALLEVDKLYTTFTEVVDVQKWAGQMPTNALLVSGPSKSADIEQTLAYGVHGPKELIIILI